jgi:hypothetical protein
MDLELTARAVDEQHLEVDGGSLEPGVVYVVVGRIRSKTQETTRHRFPSLAGSVLRYDEPFEPALDPAAWDTLGPPPT